jgi:hypothetical protein
MQPVDHLDSIAVFDVSDVEVVLEFDDFEAFDLSEEGCLIVEEEIVWVLEAEKCPVAVDLRFGIARKMCPDVFSIWFQNDLIRRQLFQLSVNDKRAHKHHQAQHKHAHRNEPFLAHALLLLTHQILLLHSFLLQKSVIQPMLSSDDT